MADERERSYWTPEMIAYLAQLLPDHTTAQCATEMSIKFGIDINRRSVHSAANTHCRELWLSISGVNRALVAARQEHMSRLAREGVRVSIIADRMGMKISTIYEAIPNTERSSYRVSFRLPFDYEPLRFRCAPLDVPPEPVTDAGKLLVDCERCDCKWQIGVSEYGEAKFCADAVASKSAYCETHRQRSRASDTPQWIKKGQAKRFIAWRKKQAETEKQEEQEFQEAA